MSDQINGILKLTKSKPEPHQDPISTKELGGGYVLVHTHSNPAEASERGAGYSTVDFYEIRHPASEHILAGLTGMSGKDTAPVVKIGVIVEEHKAPGIAQSVYDAMKETYGVCQDDVLSYLKTHWGASEPEMKSQPETGGLDEVFRYLGKSASGTSYDLGDGYSLTHVDDWENNGRPYNYWDIQKDGKQAGFVTVNHNQETAANATPTIGQSEVSSEHRGLGLGRKAYQKLSEHYGSLASDEERSPAAKKAWQSIGGRFQKRPGQDSNRHGRYYLDSGQDHVKWLDKSELKKGMLVKVSGQRGWHKLKDIKDSGIPAHEPGGGNHYTFEHNKTGDDVTVHQDHLEDMADESELTLIKYLRRYPKKDRFYLSKTPDQSPCRLHEVIDSCKDLQKFAAGFAMGGGAGASGPRALVKSDRKERVRKLNSLSGETQIGISTESGQRSFLLFRGMDQEEFEATLYPDIKVETDQHSVWTPYPDVAMQFSPKGFLVGAWINEENLILRNVSVDKQYDEELGRLSLFKIIVKPHNSPVLSTDNTREIIERYKQQMQENRDAR